MSCGRHSCRPKPRPARSNSSATARPTFDTLCSPTSTSTTSAGSPTSPGSPPRHRRRSPRCHPRPARERLRYRRGQWAHGPKLVEHGPDGEPWRGFASAKPLDSIGTGVVLVPMPGHTRGHAAVAVDAGHRWVLHCGDAFYHRGTLDGRFRVPFVMRAEEKLLSYNRNQLRDNQARIVELHRRHDPDLLIVCAHDPDLYQLARDTA